jgi:RNA polymerase sigma-70 factor (ECF subfamily)
MSIGELSLDAATGASGRGIKGRNVMREAQVPDNGIAMTRDEERRLIRRAQAGHADAFRDLVDAYKDRLFAFVWRMVRNHHEAEDLAQGAFVRAYESLASYSETYAFSTWLFTIAYRLTLNHLRKKRAISGGVELELHAAPVSEDASARVASTEDARRLKESIWAAVDQLSPPQRSAVLLFYCEEMSCQEIGVVLGMPAVTVKSHLHRAREKLKDLLADQQAEDWTALRTFRTA